MNIKNYADFQKSYYEKISDDPDNKVVGNYNWHEQFPYETYLLYKNGDIRMPIFEDFSSKKALDFGCGPGRMVNRMSKIFGIVDGVDISPNLLLEAKKRNPNNNFYESNGLDLGNCETYDFIYCTISMQHISARETRLKILNEMAKKLNANGKITLQLAFVNDNNFFNRPTPNAKYMENKFDLITTNGGQDVVIMPQDLNNVKNDFNAIFKNTNFWFCDINLMKKNLNGAVHGDYWASHWIFIHAEKQ